MKLKTLISVFITSASLGLALFFAVPHICNKIMPSLLVGTELEGQKIHLNYISPWKLIGNIELKKDGLMIELPRFVIHYTLKGLFQKRLDKISVDGLYIDIDTKAVPLPSIKKDTEQTSFSLIFPISVNEIAINNGHASIQRLTHQDLSFTFNNTFFLQTKKIEEGFEFSALRGQVQTQGTIENNTNFTLKKDNNQLNLNGNTNLPLAPLTSMLSLDDAQGTVTARFSATLREDLTTVENYNVNITGNQLSFVKKETHISVHKGLRLLIDGTNKHLNYTTKNLISINDNELDIQTQGTVNLNTLVGMATATLQQRESIAVKPAEKSPIQKNLRVTLNTVEMNITHRGFDIFNIAMKSKKLQHQNFIVQGFDAHITGTQHNGNVQAKAQIKLDTTHLDKDTSAHELTLEENLYFNSQTGLRASGNFTINKILYLNEEMALIKGNTLLDPTTIQVQGAVISLFTQNIRLPFSASYIFNTGVTEGKATLTTTLLNQEQFPQFIQKHYPEGLSFAGKVKADIDFHFRDILTTKTTLQLTQGVLSLDSGLKVSGITTHVEIPDIVTGRSFPSQKLLIDAISYNKIHLSNLNLSYRLENYNELFLEKSSFKWCNGRVESNSLLLSAKNKDFQITLYCDRIGFSELLGQLGLPDAEGTGSLNGRLPISYNNGKFLFDDGFLFSSPGDTGIIKFTNTDTLRQSLGGNIGETHLEYSMRAIEDFQYNWTTLSFNSEGEDLTVAMKLDGKPASPLPYAYKNGMMVRSDKGPGLQHPVNLNVNFHLPLAELLRYGTNIQSLMEKM